jgi:hypothetical protein
MSKIHLLILLRIFLSVGPQEARRPSARVLLAQRPWLDGAVRLQHACCSGPRLRGKSRLVLPELECLSVSGSARQSGSGPTCGWCGRIKKSNTVYDDAHPSPCKLSPLLIASPSQSFNIAPCICKIHTEDFFEHKLTFFQAVSSQKLFSQTFSNRRPVAFPSCAHVIASASLPNASTHTLLSMHILIFFAR